MSIGSGVPYNSHTGNGVTTTFAYGFTLLDAGDLVVTVNGSITSAYSVTGLGVAAGGTVVFDTAPASGAAIFLQRTITLQRATDYQTNGDLLAKTVNNDFDRLWMATQGVDAVVAGTVRAPYPETMDELPAAADRADGFLKFDGTGKVVPWFGSDPTDATALAADLASTASGKGADLVGFDWALIPSATNKASWGIQTARSGKPNILRLIPPAQWAAILAGTSTYDCTTELESAITNWSGFYAPAGLYNYSRPLAWYGVEDGNAITIEGDGSSLTIFQKTTNTAGIGSNVQRGGSVTDMYTVDAAIILKADNNYFNCHTTLRGFRLKTSASGVYGIYAPRTSRLTMQDVNIYGFTVGFYTFDSWFSEFSKVEINCLNRASSYGIRWANDGSGAATGTTVNMHRVYVRQAVYGYHLYGIDYASLSNCACDTGYTGGGGSLPYYFEACNIEMTGSGAENHTLQSGGAIVRVSGGHLTLLNFRGYLITGAANAGSIYASDSARVTIGGVRIDDYVAVNGAYNYRCEVGAAIFRVGANSLPTNGSATVTYSSSAYEFLSAQTTPQYKNSTGTYNVDLSLRATGAYDPASLAAGASRSTLTLNVPGAAVGDYCSVSFSNPVAGYNWFGQVTAANTVTVTEHNSTAGSLDPGSGTVRAMVTKQ